MQKKEFLNKIEEILEIDDDSLTGSEALADIEEWDSLAVMGFIAMVDTNFDITLDADKIQKCETVNDLCSLLDEKIEG